MPTNPYVMSKNPTNAVCCPDVVTLTPTKIETPIKNSVTVPKKLWVSSILQLSFILQRKLVLNFLDLVQRICTYLNYMTCYPCRDPLFHMQLLGILMHLLVWHICHSRKCHITQTMVLLVITCLHKGEVRLHLHQILILYVTCRMALISMNHYFLILLVTPARVTHFCIITTSSPRILTYVIVDVTYVLYA